MEKLRAPIRRYGIVSNGDKPGCEALAQRACRYLTKRGLFCEEISQESFEGSELDCLIVIGGDGTILKQINRAVTAKLPLLGINMGRLGFLSEVEPSWLEEGLEALAEGAYSTETRSLLCGTFEGKESLALNDVMLAKKHPSRTVEVGIVVNGEEIGEYGCDGILVSSPTGSTGYALSAGGPILTPELPVLMVTPVCAHRLSARPMLFPHDATVVLTLLDDHDNQALACADGDLVFRPLRKGDALKVKKSAEEATFLRIRENNFFQLIRNKLG